MNNEIHFSFSIFKFIFLVSFDVEYRKAFGQLSNKQLAQLHMNDRPPAERAVFCRSYFRDLELKVR